MKQNYLERIAIALETLVAQGNSLSAEFDTPLPEKAKVVETERVPFEPEQIMQGLRDILKDALLEVGRAGNKEKARDVMTSFGYKKLSEIADSDLEPMIDKIKAIK